MHDRGEKSFLFFKSETCLATAKRSCARFTSRARKSSPSSIESFSLPRAGWLTSAAPEERWSSLLGLLPVLLTFFAAVILMCNFLALTYTNLPN